MAHHQEFGGRLPDRECRPHEIEAGVLGDTSKSLVAPIELNQLRARLRSVILEQYCVVSGLELDLKRVRNRKDLRVLERGLVINSDPELRVVGPQHQGNGIEI